MGSTVNINKSAPVFQMHGISRQAEEQSNDPNIGEIN